MIINKDSSIIELKAYAYDLIANKEAIERELMQVNKFIVIKLQETIVEKKVEIPIKEKK